ncbi:MULTISPECIES: alpha/beta hydrolase [unclassified Aureispira]|uniref:alpha/beta hydrolase n=1 Tax=unclassified Aureispira TaxID=2649989 RepID=UPI000695B7E3|nr:MULTISPECIES: alpha/beta hydrolase [unclassified Aureispira]WMX17500.1 alpha/beta hydrolase [Aureispira sp. CCB-E]
MATVQAKMATFFLRKLKSRAFKLMDNHTVFRAEKEKIFSRVPCPKSVKVKYFNIEGVEAARFIPRKSKYAHKIVLYLHGGGYTSGSIKSHAGLIGKIASETGIPHIAINYRLAPEHTYPAALNDAIKAYLWLIEKEHFNPKDIILMGDSAGGGLTLSTLLKIKKMGLENPLAAVVISPWTDLTVSGDSALSNPEKDPILDVAKAREWGQWYAGNTPLEHPFVSPLFGDLSDLPPILIQVGTEEILLSDAVRFAAFAAMKDSDVTLMIEDGMSHVWHFFWQYIPEAKTAIQNIAQYLDKKITQQEPINEWQMMRTESSNSIGRRTATVAKLSYEAFKLGKNVLRKKISN